MVVVTPVEVKPAHAEELMELLERSHAAHTLRNGKPMNHLVAGSVADPSRPIGLTNEADREASFSVYETDDPADLDQSFLLIVRTRHVVTIVNARSDGTMSSAGCSDVPAYSRIL